MALPCDGGRREADSDGNACVSCEMCDDYCVMIPVPFYTHFAAFPSSLYSPCMPWPTHTWERKICPIKTLPLPACVMTVLLPAYHHASLHPSPISLYMHAASIPIYFSHVYIFICCCCCVLCLGVVGVCVSQCVAYCQPYSSVCPYPSNSMHAFLH